MKIACLSDLHIDWVADPTSLDVAHAAFQAARDTGADHIIVAGDLFDSAAAMLRDGEVVRAALGEHGLWHPDRLSIVPGNHDLFHLGHRGGRLGMAVGLVRTLQRDGRANLAAFERWVDNLIPASARVDGSRAFPFLKVLGGVSILGANSVGPNTALSIGGWWSEQDARAARLLMSRATGCRLMAIHHPPEPPPPTSRAKGGVSYGFPLEAFIRLQAFGGDASLDEIVCGHIHDTGGGPWTWRLGERTTVHLLGRTGGMHGAERSFVLLEGPVEGGMLARTVRF